MFAAATLFFVLAIFVIFQKIFEMVLHFNDTSTARGESSKEPSASFDWTSDEEARAFDVKKRYSNEPKATRFPVVSDRRGRGIQLHREKIDDWRRSSSFKPRKPEDPLSHDFVPSTCLWTRTPHIPTNIDTPTTPTTPTTTNGDDPRLPNPFLNHVAHVEPESVPEDNTSRPSNERFMNSRKAHQWFHVVRRNILQYKRMDLSLHQGGLPYEFAYILTLGWIHLEECKAWADGRHTIGQGLVDLAEQKQKGDVWKLSEFDVTMAECELEEFVDSWMKLKRRPEELRGYNEAADDEDLKKYGLLGPAIASLASLEEIDMALADLADPELGQELAFVSERLRPIFELLTDAVKTTSESKLESEPESAETAATKQDHEEPKAETQRVDMHSELMKRLEEERKQIGKPAGTASSASETVQPDRQNIDCRRSTAHPVNSAGVLRQNVAKATNEGPTHGSPASHGDGSMQASRPTEANNAMDETHRDNKSNMTPEPRPKDAIANDVHPEVAEKQPSRTQQRAPVQASSQPEGPKNIDLTHPRVSSNRCEPIAPDPQRETNITPRMDSQTTSNPRPKDTAVQPQRTGTQQQSTKPGPSQPTEPAKKADFTHQQDSLNRNEAIAPEPQHETSEDDQDEIEVEAEIQEEDEDDEDEIEVEAEIGETLAKDEGDKIDVKAEIKKMPEEEEEDDEFDVEAEILKTIAEEEKDMKDAKTKVLEILASDGEDSDMEDCTPPNAPHTSSEDATHSESPLSTMGLDEKIEYVTRVEEDITMESCCEEVDMEPEVKESEVSMDAQGPEPPTPSAQFTPQPTIPVIKQEQTTEEAEMTDTPSMLVPASTSPKTLFPAPTSKIPGSSTRSDSIQMKDATPAVASTFMVPPSSASTPTVPAVVVKSSPRTSAILPTPQAQPGVAPQKQPDTAPAQSGITVTKPGLTRTSLNTLGSIPKKSTPEGMQPVTAEEPARPAAPQIIVSSPTPASAGPSVNEYARPPTPALKPEVKQSIFGPVFIKPKSPQTQPAPTAQPPAEVSQPQPESTLSMQSMRYVAPKETLPTPFMPSRAQSEALLAQKANGLVASSSSSTSMPPPNFIPSKPKPSTLMPPPDFIPSKSKPSTLMPPPDFIPSKPKPSSPMQTQNFGQTSAKAGSSSSMPPPNFIPSKSAPMGSTDKMQSMISTRPIAPSTTPRRAPLVKLPTRAPTTSITIGRSGMASFSPSSNLMKQVAANSWKQQQFRNGGKKRDESDSIKKNAQPEAGPSKTDPPKTSSAVEHQPRAGPSMSGSSALSSSPAASSSFPSSSSMLDKGKTSAVSSSSAESSAPDKGKGTVTTWQDEDGIWEHDNIQPMIVATNHISPKPIDDSRVDLPVSEKVPMIPSASTNLQRASTFSRAHGGKVLLGLDEPSYEEALRFWENRQNRYTSLASQISPS
ncbi:hypothetical protein ACEPAI_1791 [Sanghuangporus weigelae]